MLKILKKIEIEFSKLDPAISIIILHYQNQVEINLLIIILIMNHKKFWEIRKAVGQFFVIVLVGEKLEKISKIRNI